MPRKNKKNMSKTCEAFHWTLYVILVSFIAWEVWFQAGQMDYFAAPMMPSSQVSIQKTVDAPASSSMRLPMKPSEATGSVEERSNCKLTRYEGNAVVRGWYEEESLYGKKALVLKVADEDRTKLPEKVRTWADGTPLESIILANVDAQMRRLLIKASAQEPTNVELSAVDVYCEGPPVAVLAAK